MKGIAGFYYVHVDAEQTVYECKAKGIFRKDGIKPLVGDNVILEAVDEPNKIGNISRILPRRNALIRPAVANIDQAMIIFAIVKPEPSLGLLDRFLVTMENHEIPCLICFNKKDLATKPEQDELRKAYESCGFSVCLCSAGDGTGLKELALLLKGKTTVFAGPSGVGKSTILNYLHPQAGMKTAALSERIERGRHTTRHSEIFALGGHTYICDTPGFTAFFLGEMEKEDLRNCYPEFAAFADSCRFRACVHIGEPDCGVKKAVEAGKISLIRYRNYIKLYDELKAAKRY